MADTSRSMGITRVRCIVREIYTVRCATKDIFIKRGKKSGPIFFHALRRSLVGGGGSLPCAYGGPVFVARCSLYRPPRFGLAPLSLSCNAGRSHVRGVLSAPCAWGAWIIHRSISSDRPLAPDAASNPRRTSAVGVLSSRSRVPPWLLADEGAAARNATTAEPALWAPADGARPALGGEEERCACSLAP